MAYNAVRLPAKKENCREHQIGSDVAVYDESGRRVHVLNETAYRIWQRCDGESLLSDLVAEMGAFYSDVPEASLRNDVERVLDEFRQKDLLTENCAEQQEV